MRACGGASRNNGYGDSTEQGFNGRERVRVRTRTRTRDENGRTSSYGVRFSVDMNTHGTSFSS
jgi:hypothetical protein